MTIVIINGPNLNLLGKREPELYGATTFEDHLESLKAAFPDVEFIYFQSNSEGSIVSAIQRYGFSPEIDGIAVNPGAYAHYSYAIADAIRAVPAKVMEVHISNIHARESFRATSVTAPACVGVITGCGLYGYNMAVSYLLDK